VTTSRHCAFDGHCPNGETCVHGSAPRFVDNHDGTITDRQSCLVWEKKDMHKFGMFPYFADPDYFNAPPK
jgi:hypothetical protein